MTFLCLGDVKHHKQTNIKLLFKNYLVFCSMWIGVLAPFSNFYDWMIYWYIFFFLLNVSNKNVEILWLWAFHQLLLKAVGANIHFHSSVEFNNVTRCFIVVTSFQYTCVCFFKKLNVYFFNAQIKFFSFSISFFAFCFLLYILDSQKLFVLLFFLS